MKDYAIDSNIRDRIHNTIFIISMHGLKKKMFLILKKKNHGIRLRKR